MIRKARSEDADRINQIYEAIHEAEEKGLLTVGWSRGVYPIKQTAIDGINRGDMFVYEEDGHITASCVINQVQLTEYMNCPWVHEALDSEVMVIHTLAVDPSLQSRGCGSKLVEFYEQYAREHNCRVLRMDTQEKNLRARDFYKRRGYSEPGIVLCTFNGIPNVRLVCLEKYL